METLNYGKIIKMARESRKMTQTVLGGKIGVGKTAVCNYEASPKFPPKNIFAKIAEALSTKLGADIISFDKVSHLSIEKESFKSKGYLNVEWQSNKKDKLNKGLNRKGIIFQF